MKQRKNRANNRYVPEDRKRDESRDKVNHRRQAMPRFGKTRAWLEQNDDGSFSGYTS